MIENFKQFNEKFSKTTSNDYYNTLKDIMDDDTFSQIIQGDKMAEQILRQNLKFIKSEDGNIFFVYGENSQFIIVTGLIHKNRKLNVSDFKKYPELFKDIDDLMIEIIEKAAKGKVIWCFPNHFSERIINRKLVKKAKEMGYNIKIDIEDTYEAPDGLTYKNMKIYIS
jgi:hypothetical protein